MALRVLVTPQALEPRPIPVDKNSNENGEIPK